MTHINRKRIFIENVRPSVDGGLYPIKREIGTQVPVIADIFRDGHQKIVVWARYKATRKKRWNKVSMKCTNPGLDIYEASFTVGLLGFHEYYIEAFCDDYGSWVADTQKKVDAGVDISSDLLEGLALATSYRKWLATIDREYAKKQTVLAEKAPTDAERWAYLSDKALVKIMSDNPDPTTRVTSQVYLVRVDREKARFAAWYECFPRSCAFEEGKHGTFKDVIRRLPHIARMGFDVLYFTPIHPVGTSKRKGPNNSLICSQTDPGCPYSVGSELGGHDAIEPALGTFEDFDNLVKTAAQYGIEIALDFAVNCSPDHPYLKNHPKWFAHRSDGSIKYAENPPKKYEDIYPLNFETSQYKELWEELLRLFLFWAKRGVRIFRVDNPHTKPFVFWKWVIAEVHKKYEDVIFLAEAFTRPRVMQALAKVGFTQSYTYFTWRNTKNELTEYLNELSASPLRDYYRPNLFTNTPDIFPPFLQSGGRPAYKIRAVLATTLSPSYGMFQGFELCQGTPVPGREEYLNSDKYEIRYRDWEAPGNIVDYISKLNRIRHENNALQQYGNLTFFDAQNDDVIFYGKFYDNNHVLVIVNLNPFLTQSAFVMVPIERFNIGEDEEYDVTDLITGKTFSWKGRKNYVELNPEAEPAHVLQIKKRS